MSVNTQETVIAVHQLRKDFKYWADKPSSLKSVLVDLLRGRIRMGRATEFNVFANVDFEIKRGDFVGIMGRNGAGKSTILKLLSGIYAPTSGTIEIRDRLAPLIELGAGFHPDLSGYENIFLNSAILGFGRKATLEALPQILDFAELGDRIHMPTKNYSSGMLVRLGFSIATHLAAPIILVDEVLAVGDAGFQEKCLRKVEQLHKEGRTIIVVTHTPQVVLNHCSRCIVIGDQKKLYDGPPAQGIEVYLNAVNTPLRHVQVDS